MRVDLEAVRRQARSELHDEVTMSEVDAYIDCMSNVELLELLERTPGGIK